MEEFVSGIIDSIVFASEETGFCVARIKEPRAREVTTIVGNLPGIQPGETILCRGEWKHHSQHGKQFEVQHFELKLPADLLGIQKYLESGLIKGIGPAYAKRIIDYFGTQTLSVIDQTPERLLEVAGIGEKRVEMIERHWKDQRSIRKVMIFLRSHEVSPAFAQKIYKAYGDKSIEKVTENPYALAKELFGVGFKTADKIAAKLGVEKESPVRIDAAIEHALWELSQEGHVCYPEKQLILYAEKTLEVAAEIIAQRLSELEKEGRVIRRLQLHQGNAEPFIWVRPLFFSELGIAREIERIIEAPSYFRTIDVEKALEWIEKQLGLTFAVQQKAAIAMSFTKKFHIITGGPGTGKSTITLAILKIAEKLTSSILLAAPTGRAAKRLAEITQKKASTIHSLLEYDFRGGFKKNKDSPLKCDLIIVDEASMIDTGLMFALLKAIPSQCRVIFIGDIDQLPSVGPGNVLKDMIQSERLPVSILTEIFRQAAGSQIVVNAHRVNQGLFPFSNQNGSSDFHFLEGNTPEEILTTIYDLVTFKLSQKYQFHPIDDIQVMSPMKRGVIGTENLNLVLQQKLNPSDVQLTKMGRSFCLGDKVMQIRNNYNKGVFNGDVGRISIIDFEQEKFFVQFDQLEVDYDFSEIDELVLAYAVSVHKYQGSECPCVILPIHTSHFKLLYRNLVYTAITRGRKLVILVGSKKAMAIAVKNNEAFLRYTGLKLLIAEQFSVKTLF